MTGDFLSAEGERAWTYLRRHLDRSRSFWLGVILTEDVRAAGLLRERTQWNRRARAEPFLSLVAPGPSELESFGDRLETEAPGPPGVTWVQGIAVADREWDAAWGRLLQGLNHRRDSLRSRLGGLVLVMPHSVKELAQRTAADLWSVRDLLVDLPTSAPAPVEVLAPAEPGAGVRIGVEGQSLGEGVADEAVRLLALPRSALATTERSRVTAAISAATAVGNDQQAAVLLLALAEGYLAERDRAGARDVLDRVLATESVEHETRVSSLWSAVDLAMEMGDLESAWRHADTWARAAEDWADRLGTPEALRDLSVSLEKVGDTRTARGDLPAAEDAYTRSLDIAQRLADQLGTPQALRDLAYALSRLAAIRDDEGLRIRATKAGAAADDLAGP